MDFLKKYMLFILMLANMTSEYRLLQSFSNVFFYSILALSIPIFIVNINDFTTSLKKNQEIVGLMLIYAVAQVCFQLDFATSRDILYSVSKVVVFGIMALCINLNYDFYLKKLPVIFSYFIVVLIAMGWVINRTNVHGSIVFGFVNRNVACTVATAGFAGFLFFREKLRLIDYVFIAFLLLSILYGGSRNALAMCVLIVLVRYGVSFSTIIAGTLMLALIIFVLPELGIEATAFDRIVGTIDGSVSLDREEEREVAIKMIAMRPWTGWGYSYTIPEGLGVIMSAHNGYLGTIVNLGYPCGLSVLAIIIFGSLKRLSLFKYHNPAVNYYLAILISTLFGANQESYLIGVNQFTTNYFFVAFVVLGLYKSKYGYIIRRR